MTAVLALAVGALFTIGTYLLLQRTLTHVIMGLALMGHGANILLLLVGGPAGQPPLTDGQAPAEIFADPMPQALALTAIVISFGVTAFLLVMAWRASALGGNDIVEDDVEDRLVASGRGGGAEGVDETEWAEEEGR